MEISSTSDYFDTPYYRITKILCWSIGIWPYQPVLSKCLMFTLSLLFALSILIPECRQFNKLSDFDGKVDCLPSILLTSYCVLKPIFILKSSAKIRKLLDQIITDWQSLSTDEDKLILNDYTQNGKVYVQKYLVYLLVSCISYMLQPTIFMYVNGPIVYNGSTTSMSDAALHMDYGVDVSSYRTLVLIHAYVGVMYVTYVVAVTDTLFITVVQHSCGMFVVLGRGFKQIAADEKEKYNLHPVKSQDSHYQSIFSLFRRHLYMLEYCGFLESAFTSCLFVDISLVTLMISITGLQTVMHLGSLEEILRYGSFCIAQLLHLLLLCGLAQIFQDHSLKPNYSILKSRWYLTSERSIKLLQLVIIRSSRPCMISAGKFFILSIEFFTTVLRTSMSYFTVLRSVQ